MEQRGGLSERRGTYSFVYSPDARVVSGWGRGVHPCNCAAASVGMQRGVDRMQLGAGSVYGTVYGVRTTIVSRYHHPRTRGRRSGPTATAKDRTAVAAGHRPYWPASAVHRGLTMGILQGVLSSSDRLARIASNLRALR